MSYSQWKRVSRSATGLRLDGLNPRIPPATTIPSELDLICELLIHEEVFGLARSIALSGYFPSEPMISVLEERRLVVVEGNRRLAACKLLLKPELAPKTLESKFRVLAASMD